MLYLLPRRQHREDEKHECGPLQINAGLHQLVAVFPVEFTAFGHADHADNQHAENGSHRNRHQDEKCSAHEEHIYAVLRTRPATK